MSWCCGSCYRRPRRGCAGGVSRPRCATGSSASSKAARRRAVTGRRGRSRRSARCRNRGWPGRRRWPRCCGSTVSGCTVTSPCTPGTARRRLDFMTDSINSEVMDWDSVYREEGGFEGPPPWNIGEPQPELAALIQAGKVRSDVLDAGCGHAELSLALAADGYTVVGIELTPTAVAAATKAAQERNLPNATFVQDDITTFTGFDGRFNPTIASPLFHSLPIEGRDGDQQSVSGAATPGAMSYVLVFAKGAFPP